MPHVVPFHELDLVKAIAFSIAGDDQIWKECGLENEWRYPGVSSYVAGVFERQSSN